MTDQRKEFEAWAKSNQELFTAGGFDGYKLPTGEYYHDDEQSAWKAWQARGAKKVKLPKTFFLKINWETNERENMYPESDVRDAIRAAGYEVE